MSWEVAQQTETRPLAAATRDKSLQVSGTLRSHEAGEAPTTPESAPVMRTINQTLTGTRWTRVSSREGRASTRFINQDGK